MILEVEQRTEEWAALRLGRVTGSRVAEVLAEIKNGEAAKRKNYRAELIVEILTGRPIENFQTPAMLWGLEQEAFARAAYELLTGATVDTVGFAIHPTINRFGASPDGFIGEEGLIEIKCPNTATHLEYLLASGNVPKEYEPQMLAAMACTGRKWCDFASFDPRLPAHLQLYVCRLYRDEKRIAEMEEKVRAFLLEVDEMLKRLELPF